MGSPAYALAGILGLGFVTLVAYDIAAGVAAFSIIVIGENVSVVGAGSPLIKLAGGVLMIFMLRKHVPILLLLRERPAMACAAVFFVTWAGASSVWAQDPNLALGSAFRFALDVMFLFVVYGAVRERRHVRWLAYSFVAGAVITSFVGAAGLVATGRLAGANGDPNYFASILVPALALAAFALAGSARSHVRTVMGVSLVCIGGAVFLTGSRGGLVSLAVSFVIAVIVGGPFRKHIVAALAAVLILGVGYYAFVASPAAVARLTYFTAEGGSGRTDLWKVATSVAADRPLLGAGAGNFQVVEPAYAAETRNLSQVQEIVDTPNVVHNTYLSILAELGPPGLLAFLFIAGSAIASTAQSIRTARAAGNRELEFLGRGTLVALAGLFTAFFFLTGEYEKYLWLFIGLGAALSSVASRPAKPGDRDLSTAL